MPGTITHKHTAINPSTPTPRSDDVDGANWLQEHKLNAPEIGAVLVGDPSQSDGGNWVATGLSGQVLTTRGPGLLPVWQPAGFAVVTTVKGDLIVGSAPDGVAARYAIGAQGQILTVDAGMPTWKSVIPFGLQGSIPWYSLDGTLSTIPPGTNGQVLTMVGSAPAWAVPPPSFANPMLSVGDIIRGGAGGAATRLVIGDENFVLTSVGGLPAWVLMIPNGAAGAMLYYTSTRVLAPILPGTADQVLTMIGGVPTWVTGGGGGGATLPINQPGDLVAGDAGGIPVRFPVGTPGQVLTAQAGGGKLVWSTLSPGFSNPMTTLGDVITGAAGGAAQRLGIGSAGWVLTVVGGVPVWQALPPSFGNPMTTAQDLIVGGAAGAPGRLGVGSNGNVLTVTGGVVGWAAPAASGMANPMTTLGDLIAGLASGVPTRLGIVAAGAVLISGASPAWSTGPLVTSLYVNVAAAPGTPPANQKVFYAKADKHFYAKDDAGFEGVLVEGTGVLNIVNLSQAAYDGLGTKVATTLYVIT
jgi:hypothetical protein